jgi:hypothetical protein
MLHRWAAPALVLALCALVPEQAAGQTQQSPGRKSAGALGQNYPNPFNPETFLPMHVGYAPDHVGAPDCSADEGKQHVVTLRIYNVLAQLVAIPVLQASSGGSTVGAQPVNGIALPCGDWVAYWNGHFLNTGREVASGVYISELIVDGQRTSRKMFVAK